MNKIYLVFIALLFLAMISCNSNDGSTSAIIKDSLTNDSPSHALPKSLSGCYSMIQQKDTVTLRINVSDSNVSGRLQYKWHEKDHNDGVIKGTLRNNRIVANYTFQSEGMNSVREVIFAIREDSLFEGYGEIVVKSDTARFANPSELTFMKNPFIKVDCGNK